MDMDSRKEKILEAVVLDYIQTAEPVGSRTISKKYDLGVSPATIRNEMADLEEMGLIEQPHTSAGRIPSDKGYRYYVDYLMQHDEVKSEARELIKESISKKTTQVEETVSNILNTLSQTSGYTSLMLLNEPATENKLKLLQLMPLETGRALMVIVTDDDKIENRFIQIPPQLGKEDLELVSQMLNMHLKGLSTDGWQQNILENIFSQLNRQKQVVDTALEMLGEILHKNDTAKEKIFYKGGLNMLTQPEFKDVNKVHNILMSLENKDTMNKILHENTVNEISVKIGTEHDIPDLKDCSIIVASYKNNGKEIGKVGLLGPKRMDYSNSMAVLDVLLKDLNGGEGRE